MSHQAHGKCNALSSRPTRVILDSRPRYVEIGDLPSEARQRIEHTYRALSSALKDAQNDPCDWRYIRRVSGKR